MILFWHVNSRSAEACCELLCSVYFVYLSVCPFAYLENRTTELHQIFCACYVWPSLSTPLMALRYVMYFRFSGRRHTFSGASGENQARRCGQTLVNSGSVRYLCVWCTDTVGPSVNKEYLSQIHFTRYLVNFRC